MSTVEPGSIATFKSKPDNRVIPMVRPCAVMTSFSEGSDRKPRDVLSQARRGCCDAVHHYVGAERVGDGSSCIRNTKQLNPSQEIS